VKKSVNTLRAVRSTLHLLTSSMLRTNTLIATTSSQDIKEMWPSKSLMVYERQIKTGRERG
jgi:hypothetical protein